MNNKLCQKEIDNLTPGGTIGSRIVYYESLTSTFDKIKELPFCNGLTVVCSHQSSGCGRLGRTWESNAGGVYLTFGIRNERRDFELPFVTLICAIGVHRALTSLVPCSIKWPNDIVSGTRKLCGILVRTMADAEGGTIILGGIGINVNNSFDSSLPYATSLWAITGERVNENMILARVLDEIDKAYRLEEVPRLIEYYKEHCINLGREVSLVYQNKEIQGVCTDILPDGTMVVSSGGHSFAVNSGEVSVKGIYQ